MDNSKSRPRIVVITGIDGSGKSTCCHLVASGLRAQGFQVEVAGTWGFAQTAERVFGDSRLGAQELAHLLEGLHPRSRLPFLCLGWSESLANAGAKLAEGLHAQDESHSTPPVPTSIWEESLLLVDGYWYKHAATEIARGVLARHHLAFFEGFLPEPDAVFLLDLPWEQAQARKGGKLSRYESLLDWQRACDVLRTWARERSWATLPAHDEQGPGSVSQDLMTRIHALLSLPEGAPHPCEQRQPTAQRESVPRVPSQAPLSASPRPLSG